MATIQYKIKNIFKLIEKLDEALSLKDFEKFKTIETTYSDQLKNLLSTESEENLVGIIEELKKIENLTVSIQDKAKISLIQLKEESLQFKRNKNKIKAYGRNT